jgi:hypothetical protein
MLFMAFSSKLMKLSVTANPTNGGLCFFSFVFGQGWRCPRSGHRRGREAIGRKAVLPEGMDVSIDATYDIPAFSASALHDFSLFTTQHLLFRVHAPHYRR